jgi:hypothetical protein
MKIRLRRVKYFHANRESNEGTDGQINETKIIFALQFRESDYIINSAVRTKQQLDKTTFLNVQHVAG